MFEVLYRLEMSGVVWSFLVKQREPKLWAGAQRRPEQVYCHSVQYAVLCRGSWLPPDRLPLPLYRRLQRDYWQLRHYDCPVGESHVLPSIYQSTDDL